ncbi:MAG: glycoside hydrolase family 43 protein [Arachnia sp.]
MSDSRYGYLLVHFVEDRHGHGEKIYLSLSDGDNPLRWRRLGGGEAILESTAGATGVRDPHLIRRHDGAGYHVIATDLRIWDGNDTIDWSRLSRHGSRDLVIWDSPDLVTWSEARYVTVAPESAGMAWAPEAHYDRESGEYLVYWSSKLYDTPDHTDDSYSRILVARTRDFALFSEAEVFLDHGVEVIDMTVYVEDDADPVPGRVHRFAKDNSHEGRRIFQESAPGFFGDYVPVAARVGDEIDHGIEAPLIFRDNTEARWYLWVDAYGLTPQGYRALATTDLASGAWTPVLGLSLPEATKHGTVLPLLRHEYDAVAAAHPAP